MAIAIAFLLLPLVTFVSLVTLPPGRPALIGLAVAAVMVALVVPRAAPDDGTGFGRTILWIFGGAVALAALAQGLRVAAAGRVSYPLIAGLCVAGAMVPLAMLLGVF